MFIFVAFHSLFLMMSKTYGDKPLVFAFDGDGEQYMIGSEVKQSTVHLSLYNFSNAKVGNYLRLFRGALYKKFPGLARRNLTNDERRKLIDMGTYHPHHNPHHPHPPHILVIITISTILTTITIIIIIVRSLAARNLFNNLPAAGKRGRGSPCRKVYCEV